MHLARLAVGALDVPWAAPKTWTEVFWLANRRWTGPVGLTEAGWAVVSRRSSSVSLCFCLLGMLSILALGTPVVMTSAYPVVTYHVNHTIVVNVAEPDSSFPYIYRDDQIKVGQVHWGTGVSAAMFTPQNLYAGLGANKSKSTGDWFIASDSQNSEILLHGIRAVGGCEVVTDTPRGDTAFADLCKRKFDTRLNPEIVVGESKADRLVILTDFRDLISSLGEDIIRWRCYPGRIATVHQHIVLLERYTRHTLWARVTVIRALQNVVRRRRCHARCNPAL